MARVRLHRERTRPLPPAYPDDLGLLRRLVCEGLYWQDEVEELLLAIRDGGDLGELSRAGGPYISRYEAMRVELRAVRHPQLRSHAAALDEVFASHAMVLHCALDLLAVSWRSERLREEQSRLGGLGGQSVRLVMLADEIKALAERASAG